MSHHQKYLSSNLSAEEARRIKSDLISAFELHDFSRDKLLSLKTLATHLRTNTKYLSQVINQEFNCNFPSFVNCFRIEEFKRRLLDGEAQDITFYGLARECGFNNRSTFYRAFKNVEQISPMEYLSANLIVSDIDN